MEMEIDVFQVSKGSALIQCLTPHFHKTLMSTFKNFNTVILNDSLFPSLVIRSSPSNIMKR